MKARPPRAVLLAAASIGSIAAGSAHAQVLPPQGPSLTERYTAVRDRRHPDLEAPGVPVASFVLRPSLGVAGIYDDNVLATETEEQDDVAIRISPQLLFQSNWGGDNRMNVRLAAQAERYADLTTENGTDLDAATDGIAAVGPDTTVRFAARWQRQRESRRSQDVFVQTEKPVRFSTTGAGFGVTHNFSRLSLSGEASMQRFDYEDARLADGTPIDEDFRDSDLLRLRGRATYAQSPALSWFGQVTYDQRDYRQQTAGVQQRNSDGFEILGGVVFEPAVLARGEIGVGYLTRNYDSPVFEDFSGFAINGKVEFFPTQLTTVTVTAKREANDAGIPQSTGYITTGGELTVDHELLRSLILSGSVSYETDNFNGIDRKDKRWAARAVADYKMNRTFSLRLSYDYLDLKSDGVDRYKAFKDNRILFGITARL
ncbi:hypothetical protein ACFB49_34370 [Sphingomonas sp. DBB INV C78]|uniref:outer membrane beta-barrel protein n=1 Tax=Sphingomonas sp. DBB INV C78 TaxID=3349434 RepID=UPI0036D431B9